LEGEIGPVAGRARRPRPDGHPRPSRSRNLLVRPDPRSQKVLFMPRYVVGIDLGTTNSALAYADLNAADEKSLAPIKAMPIPQVVAVNDVGDRPVLPSFLYLPAANEFAAGALDLPWKK